MPRNAVWVLILGFTAFVATGPALHGAAAPPPAAATAPTRAFLDDYCTSCHNERLKTGGLSLDAVGAAHIAADAETWEKVVSQAAVARVPQGARRPDDTACGRPSPASRSARRPAADPRPSRAASSESRGIRQRDRDLLGSRSTSRRCCRRTMRLTGSTTWPKRSAARPRCSGLARRRAQHHDRRRRRSDLGPGSETRHRRQDLSHGPSTWAGCPSEPSAGCTHAHVSGRRRVQISGQLYRNESERDPRPAGSPSGRDARSTETPAAVVGRRRRGPGGAAIEHNHRVRRARSQPPSRAPPRQGRAPQIAAAFLEETSAPAPPMTAAFLRDFDPYRAEGAPHVKSITVSGPFRADAA